MRRTIKQKSVLRAGDVEHLPDGGFPAVGERNISLLRKK